jgi:hypothetical protein
MSEVFFVNIRPDGTVVGTGRCDASAFCGVSLAGAAQPHQVTAAEYAAVQAAPQNWRVVADQLVARDTMPLTVSSTSLLADGAAQVSITGIPAGTIGSISGAVRADVIEIDDGHLTFSSSRTGTITVKLVCDPGYLAATVVINAHD